MSINQTLREDTLLDAARTGDEDAFARLVEPHRDELHAHCYRMLGSVHDGEDALQESLLRAWRGIAAFEGRSALRSWLYKIATNTCLDFIARRPKRVLPIDYGPASDPHDGPGAPLVESVWVEPYPDGLHELPDGLAGPEARYEQREGVELAFVAALQLLPAQQRAALIMREVLGFSAKEVAGTLDTSVASVNSALQRARKAVDERLPERSQQATLRALGDEHLREIVEGYQRAWEAGDVDALMSMLAEDVTIAMPPMATWFRGRDRARVFFTDWIFGRRWVPSRAQFVEGRRNVRLIPLHASGQPAFGAYSWSPEEGCHVLHGVQVLTLAGNRIVDITAFVMPSLHAPFGLPERL